MECPRCGSRFSRVLKSQQRTIRIARRSERDQPEAGKRIRFRRRECIHCKTRWTTREELLGGSIDSGEPDNENPPDTEAA